ncbi:MarR family winged helix-turn-helix transcriptional regulator [Amycolatopsis endophytica]|uniref:DNA-binding MarR family transcriptional regulator n=1 Tax=Amycolatopsis endophytica TaxID=860233 RepID=A0A853B1N5_9PSEU|nr:MarR family transcriptional regulator [Amycolatopsis endophytica]NYI88744.1 DNA-binding MarR family transcriptional regulator [Amycolatopsis endophytica]
MGDHDERAVQLMRELRTAGQLQHAWINQSWQREHGGQHPAAAMLLSDLAQHGESRPSELAKRKMVDISVISRQLGQLVTAGLVERRPAPEDGRASLIRLTEAGRDQLEQWRVMHADFVRRALSDWTDDEVEALTARLTLMNQGLREALGHTPVTCPPETAEKRKGFRK